MSSKNINLREVGRKILIVDDENDVGLALKRILERNSFSVDYYSDPMSALNSYRVGYYDLAIFDIRMPGIDGTELYKRIRELDKQVKVCFVSAYEITVDELARILPDYILNCLFKKPVHSKFFIEKVSEVLSAT